MKTKMVKVVAIAHLYGSGFSIAQTNKENVRSNVKISNNLVVKILIPFVMYFIITSASVMVSPSVYVAQW
jgi:hypothetical protein